MASVQLLNHLHELAITDQVMLFQLSGYNLRSLDDTYYFCNTLGAIFDGTSYNPVACQLEGFEWANEGTNEPTIFVADPLNVIGNYPNLQGAKLEFIVTQRLFLDDSPQADPTAIKYQGSFIVQNKIEHVKGEYIKFQLSSIYDYRDETIGVLATRRCPYIYRDPNTCAYTGDVYFNYNNERVFDKKDDRCNRGVTACKLRDNLFRFGGNPQLGLF